MNVFFLMHDKIIGDAIGVYVVSQHWNGLIKLHLNILQHVFHPKDLSATCCCCYVFFFVVDKETTYFFFLNHDIGQPLK